MVRNDRSVQWITIDQGRLNRGRRNQGLNMTYKHAARVDNCNTPPRPASNQHLIRGHGEAAGAGEQSQQPAAGHWAARIALCSVGSEETGGSIAD